LFVCIASLLPIDRRSLCYGCEDASTGLHIVNSNQEVNGLMEKLGKGLNLRQHQIMQTPISLYFPADIEVHQGISLGNKYYCLDLARVFPAQAAPAEVF